jgi:hypothetical protein
MISLDVGDSLKVWDLKSNQEICCLNQKMEFTGLKDLQLLDNDTKLGVRHDNGVCIWEMNTSKIYKTLDYSLENSLIFVSNDKKKMMINNDKYELVEYSLPSLAEVKRVRLPENVENFYFLPNGDVVLLIRKEFKKKINPNNLLINRLKKNLTFIRKKRENESEDEDEEINNENESKRVEYHLVFMCWRTQPDVNAQFKGSSNFSDIDHQIEFPKIFESEFMITSLRIQSNLENEISTVVTPKNTFGFNSDIFSENQPNMDNNTINLFVGTENQQCFKINVEISQFGEIYDHQIKEIFKEFHTSTETENNNPKNYAEQMLMNMDSVVSENDELNGFEQSEPHTLTNVSFTDEIQPIHDFGRIIENDLTYRVICKEKKFPQHHSCVISASMQGVAFSDCHFDLGVSLKISDNKLFKLQCIINYRSNSKKKISAFIYNQLGIGLIKFNLTQKNIKFYKFLRKEIDLEVGLCFSESKKAFYMSNGKNIQVWDKKLNHCVYNIDTSDKIFKILLIEKRNILVIHDDENYKEISTENLECCRKIKTSTNKTLELNYLYLEPSHVIKTNHFIDTYQLNLSIFEESLSLTNFPFIPLQSCFRDEDYENPILNFAKYYFDQLNKLQQVDSIYGPLNPLIFSIYHNDTKLLETLLNKYFYARCHRGYCSPLEYAFRQGYQSAIKVICDCLVKRDHPVHFSKTDFHFLLESSLSYCHKLIATIPEPSQIKSIPRLVFMNKNVELHKCNNISHLLTNIKENEKVKLIRQSMKKI